MNINAVQDKLTNILYAAAGVSTLALPWVTLDDEPRASNALLTLAKLATGTGEAHHHLLPFGLPALFLLAAAIVATGFTSYRYWQGKPAYIPAAATLGILTLWLVIATPFYEGLPQWRLLGVYAIHGVILAKPEAIKSVGESVQSVRENPAAAFKRMVAKVKPTTAETPAGNAG